MRRRAAGRWFGFAWVFVLAMPVLWATPAPGTPKGFVVIVHPGNPVSTLGQSQLSAIFLKRERAWSDGREILPVDLASSSWVRERFTDQVHERPVAAVQSYWQGQIFSGRGVPPPELRSEAELISFVAQNPGAIGYVSDDAVLHDVKTIEIGR